jgi:hypothetical protein
VPEIPSDRETETVHGVLSSGLHHQFGGAHMALLISIAGETVGVDPLQPEYKVGQNAGGQP